MVASRRRCTVRWQQAGCKKIRGGAHARGIVVASSGRVARPAVGEIAKRCGAWKLVVTHV